MIYTGPKAHTDEKDGEYIPPAVAYLPVGATIVATCGVVPTGPTGQTEIGGAATATCAKQSKQKRHTSSLACSHSVRFWHYRGTYKYLSLFDLNPSWIEFSFAQMRGTNAQYKCVTNAQYKCAVQMRNTNQQHRSVHFGARLYMHLFNLRYISIQIFPLRGTNLYESFHRKVQIYTNIFGAQIWHTSTQISLHLRVFVYTNLSTLQYKSTQI